LDILLVGGVCIKKWSPKKILLVLSSVLVTFTLILFSWFYFTIKSTAGNIHEPLPLQINTREVEPLSVKELDPVSFLLLGVDEREDDRGRSDTMIVVTVNPTDKTTKMLSIPRDTYVPIAGRTSHDKINHSYAFGGVQMSHATVQDFLKIPINYVISINMEGFVGLIDALDGIQVTNSFAFREDNFHFAEGDIQLTGEEALSYVRMRYNDPNGDFGRQERQKIVLQAVVNKAASLQSVFAYREVLDLISDHVRTNLTFDEMRYIQKNYVGSLKNVETLSFEKGTDQMMQQIWYYLVDPEELKQHQNDLQQHLNKEITTQ
jgi:LCP family protein required for cell wall assembly